MSGRKNFAALSERMSPESKKRAQMKAEILSKDMDLAELRRARDLSQQEIAEVLHVGQASIAKTGAAYGYVPQHAAVLPRCFLNAMGAELEISARFPDRVVRIQSFESIKEPSSAHT